jgi:RHH-type proline utilization regulon transcriptional repressor/proline dehydrogenase/delta 1-pyrroline-5-carboxylate dehydrogenase
MNALEGSRDLNSDLSKHISAPGSDHLNMLLDEANLELNADNQARAVVGLVQELGKEIDGGLDEQLAQMKDLRASVFATVMADRLFRPKTMRAKAEEFFEVLEATGVPGVLSWSEQKGLEGFEAISNRRVLSRIAAIAMPIIEQFTLKKLQKYILFDSKGTPKSVLKNVNRETKRTGIDAEINYVIESAISEQEAEKNKNWYIELIERGAHAVAIKPTAIVALSDNPVASDIHRAKLESQLVEILEAVRENKDQKTGECTRVTLDMESTGTFHWTVEAFNAATARVPEVPCGIALQSYMPDTYEAVEGIVENTTHRIRGGYPELWARLVKGANITSEEYEAMANGRITKEGKADIAMFDYNFQTDAHYIELFEKMVSGGMGVVIGSMNDLTVVHCLMAAERIYKNDPEKRRKIVVSMLRGLGGAKIFPILKARYGIQSRIYTPVIAKKELVEVLAYFLRRGDELYGHGNYKGDTAVHGIGSSEWEQQQVTRYVQALREREGTNYPVPNGIKPNRGVHQPPITRLSAEDKFAMTPNANFAAKEVREWHANLCLKAKNRTDEEAEFIASQIAGESAGGAAVIYPSHARSELNLAKIRYASVEDVRRAVDVAENDKEWANEGMSKRKEVLFKATNLIHERRDELVESLMLDISKTAPQADTEINEAIDFGRLTDKHLDFCQKTGRNLKPKRNGVGVVICPWNFPIAITYQHILALLAAGNSAIVKPAPESIHSTYKLCEILWEAGVPKSALQFVPCDNQVASHLVANEKVTHIGFTGSTETALKIQSMNSSADFVGETGGVNTLIIDGKCDLKEAAKEIIIKGMGFSKQKCSGVGYVLVTPEVDRPKLEEYLVEMAKNLKVGSALDVDTDIVPLIRPLYEGDKLHRSMSECDEGEWWVLKPGHEAADVWSPGIKAVSRFESYPQNWKEVFAPLIHIVNVPNVEAAVDMQEATGFGLTGGIISSSKEAQEYVLKHMRVGNVYIRKTIVGARAGVEDFGDGRGLSHVGMHGIKTGTIEFLLMHAHVKTRIESVPSDKDISDDELRMMYEGVKQAWLDIKGKIRSTIDIDPLQVLRNYIDCVESYFSQKHYTDTPLKGEENYREFVPAGPQIIRVHPFDNVGQTLAEIYACIVAGNEVTVSFAHSRDTKLERIRDMLAQCEGVELLYQDTNEFCNYIADGNFICIHESRPSKAVEKQANESGVFINRRKPTGDPRVDLIPQYRQKSVTNVYTSHGNDGLHALND